MAKWIKNTTDSNKIWVGQVVDAGSYYEIKSIEEKTWASNSLLLTDIAIGDAIVAKDNSSNNDIIDINSAIDYLKDDLPQEVTMTNSISTAGVKDPNNMRARLIGIINETVTAGETVNLDWCSTQLQYLGEDKCSFFDGIQYYAKDAIIGDTSHFQVVDKDGAGVALGWYTQEQFDAMGEYIIEDFGYDWYMIPNTMEDIMLYKARIIPGMYIRVKYHSIGTEDVHIIVNLFRHLCEL